MAKNIKRNKLLYTDSDWTFETIERAYGEIEKIAFDELGFDIYPMQIEIVDSSSMIDAYSSNGLPIQYFHWSFGKQHILTQESYNKGKSGLAYEIIINSNPCLALLMENNTMTMQTLVLSHIMGHNHFFKNNYLFRQWTNPDAIITYMSYAKYFISKCEEKYGIRAVEEILDACHSIRDQGVDKYKRPSELSIKQEANRLKLRLEEAEKYPDYALERVLKMLKEDSEEVQATPLKSLEAEENLLYYIEKNSPKLKQWQKEIVRIVRKIAQYYYPQMQTKIANEGLACFSHYYIMNRLFDKGLVSAGNMFEFIENHTAVIAQPTPDLRSEERKKYDQYRGKRPPIPYSGINPYALGFAMMQDIKRICENPTEEDKIWFPEIAGSSWKETILDVVKNYRDESFIRQFLSPKLIREFKLFSVLSTENDTKNDHVVAIQNESGYKEVRKALAEQYDINLNIPNIQVDWVNFKGDRELNLRYDSINGRLLKNTNYKDSHKVLEQLYVLWGYDVNLTVYDDAGGFLEMLSTKEI